MCFSQPRVSIPPPILPPPPPAPSATELEEPTARQRKRGAASQLESLRVPLNPTSTPRAPRIGL